MGRPSRAGSLNQSQMTLPHPSHQTIVDFGTIHPATAAALLQAQAAAAAAASAQATQSAGGSGSVVYENSYNSFQR